MLKLAEAKRFLLDWQPTGVGLRWVLALAWWLVLGGLLRRGLRSALGSEGASEYPSGPPIKPRRPKGQPRRELPRQPYSAAA
ncbi:hypothetical protein GO988_03965 [Hymenobacter sp. HMF4947]|uniref:Uncharacterized protein n=1 Tax=Hymenobacter ginkgonis TaxID=2682976 RepID=A0A7K1TAQ9_9BACT|nr:hypothetical protein [Hymenobacter ginkgonis]MVN75473.1 hypothetical protein [Hymenobacter ginkgonis]